MLLWLWCRPAAAAPIRLLALEFPYAIRATLKSQKNKNKNKNNASLKKSNRKLKKKYLDANDDQDSAIQNLWDAAKSLKRDVYSNTNLPQETRKIPNKQTNFIPKPIWERANKTWSK